MLFYMGCPCCLGNIASTLACRFVATGCAHVALSLPFHVRALLGEPAPHCAHLEGCSLLFVHPAPLCSRACALCNWEWLCLGCIGCGVGAGARFASWVWLRCPIMGLPPCPSPSPTPARRLHMFWTTLGSLRSSSCMHCVWGAGPPVCLQGAVPREHVTCVIPAGVFVCVGFLFLFWPIVRLRCGVANGPEDPNFCGVCVLFGSFVELCWL